MQQTKTFAVCPDCPFQKPLSDFSGGDCPTCDTALVIRQND